MVERKSRDLLSLPVGWTHEVSLRLTASPRERHGQVRPNGAREPTHLFSRSPGFGRPITLKIILKHHLGVNEALGALSGVLRLVFFSGLGGKFGSMYGGEKRQQCFCRINSNKMRST